MDTVHCLMDRVGDERYRGNNSCLHPTERRRLRTHTRLPAVIEREIYRVGSYWNKQE